MGLPKKPIKAIFPIVAMHPTKDGTAYHFLGTGFFVDNSGTFLTAKHVCEGITDECKAVDLDTYGGKKTPHPISNVKVSKDFDIASGKVEGFPGIEALTIATENPPINLDVITLEYSGTSLKQIEGQRAVVLQPLHRKGYIARFYTSDFPERTQTSCLEVSFPALKGASGAPIIVEHGGSVVGMIVGNIEHELLQSHLETVSNGEKSVEEVKYNLPYGKAISWKHLNDFLTEVAR